MVKKEVKREEKVKRPSSPKIRDTKLNQKNSPRAGGLYRGDPVPHNDALIKMPPPPIQKQKKERQAKKHGGKKEEIIEVPT